jgi:catechol 2,3-dioxygenase-like lactoylglutathione lyase family enzyme
VVVPPPISVLGLELIVDDLDRAVALFVDMLGFELHERGESGVVAGETAIVTDGRVALTLLHPTTAGEARILPDRTPRLSQLIFGTDRATLDDVAGPMIEAGLALTPTQGGFYLKPEAVSGVLGFETAVVMTTDG